MSGSSLCICLSCRGCFDREDIGMCAVCLSMTCPACFAHSQIVALGEFCVPPTHAEAVRLTMTGLPN